MRGRNSSADLGPELREQARACSALQQFWPKALNPGGLEAEPPAPKRDSFRMSFQAAILPIGSRGAPPRFRAGGGSWPAPNCATKFAP